MSIKVKKWLNITIALCVFVALLVSLLLIIEALQNSEQFEHNYSILLLINVIALLGLFSLIILNVQQLLHQVYQKQVGARLTVKLVSLLVILSTLPVIILYYFALEFLHQRIDNLFDQNIELALNNALDLSQTTLDFRMREALRQTVIASEKMTFFDIHPKFLFEQLNELRQNTGAEEITLLSINGKIIASNRAKMGELIPLRPHKNAWLQLKISDNHVSLETTKNGNLYVRVITKLTYNQPHYLLQALFPIPARIQELAENVEIAFTHYKEITYLQQPLKLTFTVVLSLILLLCIFGVIWIAFFAARHFIEPLSHLVEGTIAVANGNYEKKLPVQQLDELRFLVQSFNTMTDKIAQARDVAKQSQQLVDNQRAYLEAILERLSSGVIALDHQLNLRTVNPAAEKILALALSKLIGNNWLKLPIQYPILIPLCNTIYPYLTDKTQNWQQEIILFGNTGRKVLICRGTLLHTDFNYQQQGYVIVFEDITKLVQAQREAAWTEVARRLAHEIKNPLTPIQLSTERLRHKCLPKLPVQERNLLDRMTNTIIQQVDAMKEMVNAFSDYAKISMIHKQRLQINSLVTEVLNLYQHIAINVKLDKKLPIIEADSKRLRQVLHNLIKNAIEAKPDKNYLEITTQHLIKSDFECIELRVYDQGLGIPPKLLNTIFEPYVSTKQKGSGLGLAIVKKIIEEHGGTVWIEQNDRTCIIIRLPILK
ncbi:MAG: HAMP domain-containing protein [Thiomargarita sp.]|nr:HAMP domain-containing protein [Thiomargarita sp.]